VTCSNIEKIEEKDWEIMVKQLGLADDLRFAACRPCCSISVVSSISFETGVYGSGSLDCRDSQYKSASSKMSLGVQCLTDCSLNNMSYKPIVSTPIVCGRSRV
jgi:hypothetical protein